MKKRNFDFKSVLIGALGNIYGSMYKPPKGFKLIDVWQIRSLHDDEKAIHDAKLKRERKNKLRKINMSRSHVRNACINISKGPFWIKTND